MYRRALGPEHPDTLECGVNLANVLNSQSKYADAEKILLEVVTVHRVLGPEHPDTLVPLVTLASTLISQGTYIDPEIISEHVLGVQRRALGPEHPETLEMAHIFASLGWM